MRSIRIRQLEKLVAELEKKIQEAPYGNRNESESVRHMRFEIWQKEALNLLRPKSSIIQPEAVQVSWFIACDAFWYDTLNHSDGEGGNDWQLGEKVAINLESVLDKTTDFDGELICKILSRIKESPSIKNDTFLSSRQEPIMLDTASLTVQLGRLRAQAAVMAKEYEMDVNEFLSSACFSACVVFTKSTLTF